MWPEAIVALVGGAGASAAYLAHKARNYSGGWSDSDLHRFNARRGTQAPDTNSPEFNRYLPPPPALPNPGPVPSWYHTQTPQVHDWANVRRAHEEAVARGENPYDWLRDSPAKGDGTEPPPYDGPTG